MERIMKIRLVMPLLEGEGGARGGRRVGRSLDALRGTFAHSDQVDTAMTNQSSGSLSDAFSHLRRWDTHAEIRRSAYISRSQPVAFQAAIFGFIIQLFLGSIRF